jgi:uncharacterized membrane protein
MDATALANPVFRAKLTPHRSLSQRGFLVVIGLLGLVSFVAGLVFLAIGAWPVFGFFGLDVALVAVAFKVNYREGRAFETIEITERELRLTRTSHTGRSEVSTFNPYWVRLALNETPDGRNALAFVMHGRATPFARFLTNDERIDLKHAIETELARPR